MTPYLILCWQAGDMQAQALADHLRPLCAHWRRLIDRPGGFIAVGGDEAATIKGPDDAMTVIIGDLFARCPDSGSGGLAAADGSFADLCARLARDYWGAYIAVQLGQDGEMSLFRDPIGMRDGLTWTRGTLRIAASDAMPWLEVCAPSPLAIDWQRIAQLLLDSATLAEATPLTSIDTLPAGSLLEYRGRQLTARRLWSPAPFYDRERARSADPAALRAIALNCLQAWTETYRDTMLEISGGFDSAVVAAAGDDIKRGINFFTGQLSGDERRFARAIGQQCSLPLDEVFMPVGRLGEEDLEDLPIGARPGLSSASLFHDRLLTGVAKGHAATALFTGHGGDSVFFQHPTALIAADPSFPRRDIAAYAALAKWSRQSVWTVAAHAFHLPLPRAANKPADEALAELPVTRDVHAAESRWAGELAHLPPAKRLQILGIATDRSVIGPSWRSRALMVVHPLLSQPLVEWAIAADAYQLTQGRRDRALAREAFAAMLPACVTERRGKGVLAQYFGRCLCASVPFLRTFLLDGLLVQNGVLDQARLEPMLDEDFLMRFDCYAKLRSVILAEHWARVWQDRMAAMGAPRRLADAAAS